MNKVIQDMEALGHSILALAASMKEAEWSKGEAEKELEKEVPEMVPEKEPEKEPEKKMPEQEPEKKYTLEDVRKALAEKSGEGKTAEVRELLQRHGAARLSAIDQSEYPAIMEEAQGL